MASDLKVSNVGLIVPVGAVTLTASYYDGKDARTTSASDDVDLKGHQLSARYALSKRTFAYVVTGENKTSLKTGSGTAAGNTKVEGTSIGVVHSF
jgi:predicted porin